MVLSNRFLSSVELILITLKVQPPAAGTAAPAPACVAHYWTLAVHDSHCIVTLQWLLMRPLPLLNDVCQTSIRLPELVEGLVETLGRDAPCVRALCYAFQWDEFACVWDMGDVATPPVNSKGGYGGEETARIRDRGRGRGRNRDFRARPHAGQIEKKQRGVREVTATVGEEETKAEVEAEAFDPTPPLLCCSTCCGRLAATLFSRSQLKKGPLRQCSDCVHLKLKGI